MARNITDIPNSKNDNLTDYPRGYVSDDTATEAGAVVGEAMMQDSLQFFSKLMADTSPTITPNSLPDNQANGFQLFTAFVNYVRNVLSATETAKGTVEKATTNEIDSETADKFVDAELLGGMTGGIRRKIIDIGDWDMDSTLEVAIPHILVGSKIRNVSAFIRADSNSTVYPNMKWPLNGGDLLFNVGGTVFCDNIYVTLARSAGGMFNGTEFNSTNYNRGWIIIDYVS